MNPSILSSTTHGVTSALYDAAVLALDGVACNPAGMANRLADYATDSEHASGQRDVDQGFFDIIAAVGADDQDFCKVFGDVMDAHRNA